jgi:hypothetical protein
MKYKIYAVLSLISASALADIRQWTSVDGRTLSGEAISKTETTVAVKRATDNQIVNIPINALSVDDQNYVKISVAVAQKEEPKKDTPDAVKIAAMNFPEFPYIGHANETSKPDIVGDAQCRDFYSSYKSNARFIDSKTREAMVKRLRDKIKSDKEAQGRNYKDTDSSSKKTNPTWFAARQNLRWLDKYLTPWLDKVEAAK